MKLEDRRGYSKPVVDLDMLWNIAFVVVSAVMLIITVNEKPNTPIRLWICGYALQCLVYVVLVWLEFRRRNTRRSREEKRRGVVKFRMSIMIAKRRRRILEKSKLRVDPVSPNDVNE